MSHFTHICKCGHARENHGRGGAGESCATSKVIPCGCHGLDHGPSILRETFVPGWVDKHRTGEQKVMPVVAPGTFVGLGSGGIHSCACASCTAAFAALEPSVP